MPVGERPVPAGRLAPPRSTRRVLTKGRQVWAQWPPAAFLSCRVPRSLPPRAPPLRRYCPSAMLASRSSAREERDTTATPTTVKAVAAGASRSMPVGRQHIWHRQFHSPGVDRGSLGRAAATPDTVSWGTAPRHPGSRFAQNAGGCAHRPRGPRNRRFAACARAATRAGGSRATASGPRRVAYGLDGGEGGRRARLRVLSRGPPRSRRRCSPSRGRVSSLRPSRTSGSRRCSTPRRRRRWRRTSSAWRRERDCS